MRGPDVELAALDSVEEATKDRGSFGALLSGGHGLYIY